MDLPGQQSRESPPRLRVVVPMVFSRSEEEGEEGAQGDETFRQLLVRIKDLLVREGLEIGPSDLEAYTRFVSPHGDIYLLDTSVRDCLLPDAPELRMVTDQHLNLKRKREDAAAAPAAHPAANLRAAQKDVKVEEAPWPEPPSEVRPPQSIHARPVAAPAASGRSSSSSSTSTSTSSFSTPSSSYLFSGDAGAPPPTQQLAGGSQTPTNIKGLVTPSSHGLILDQKKYPASDRFLSDLMVELKKTDSSKPTPTPAPASPSPFSFSSSPSPLSSSPSSPMASSSSSSMSAAPQQSYTRPVSDPPSGALRFPHPSRTQSLPQQQQRVNAASTASFSPAQSSTPVWSTVRTAPQSSSSSSSSMRSHTYMDYAEALRIQAQQSGLAQKLPELDNAKNEVQSYYQVRHGPRVVPEYLTDRNDAATGFYVSLDISKIDGGRGIVGRGVAPKKKDAEKLAALDALAKLQRQGAFPPITVDEPPGPGANPKTKLNEMFQNLWRTNPVFKFHTDPATGHFTAEVNVGDKVLRATGLSKAKASADVAEKALKYMTDMRLIPQF